MVAATKGKRVPAKGRQHGQVKNSAQAGQIIVDAVDAGRRLSKLSGDQLMEAYRLAPADERDVLLALAQIAKRREARRRLRRAIENEEQPVTPAVAAATQATENAWRQLEEEFGLLSSTEVSALLSPRGGVNRKLASDMRSRGELLGTQRRNTFRYPAFQFDEARREVLPWVKQLTTLARGRNLSDDDVILWMMRPTTYLGSRPDGTAPRPVDVSGDADRVVDVADKAWESRW